MLSRLGRSLPRGGRYYSASAKVQGMYITFLQPQKFFLFHSFHFFDYMLFESLYMS